MDRLVGHDFGPKINAVAGETASLLGQAEQAFRAHLAAAGTDFFGRTGIEIVWQAGQVVTVRPKVEQVVTPDRATS